MKKLYNIALIILLAVSLMATGCSSSKKGNCGCPNKKGYIGY